MTANVVASAFAEPVVPAVGISVTEADLLAWLKTAQPGERLVYHVGHLSVDRYPAESPLPAQLRLELMRVAARTMALAEEGRVLLAQKRLDGQRTAYLAIKAFTPARAAETGEPHRRVANDQGGSR